MKVKRLERLTNSVHSTPAHRQIGWGGDTLDKINLDLYAEANYGTNGGKSTSGAQLHVKGPNPAFPVAGLSVSQGAVAHSTPEAEIVAATAALKLACQP